MEYPSINTFLPYCSESQINCWILVKSEEKVAAIIRPSAFWKISSKFFWISDSDMVRPASLAPVESETKSKIPSSPRLFRRAISAGFSFTGVWSNFQSPVRLEERRVGEEGR